MTQCFLCVFDALEGYTERQAECERAKNVANYPAEETWEHAAQRIIDLLHHLDKFSCAEVALQARLVLILEILSVSLGNSIDEGL